MSEMRKEVHALYYGESLEINFSAVRVRVLPCGLGQDPTVSGLLR